MPQPPLLLSQSVTDSKSYYALVYYLVDDYMTKRATFRDEHLNLAREAHSRGELVLAGAFREPADRALLIFHAEGADIVERFVASDPYVQSGLVTRWEVRPWTVVIGGDSAPI
jgi:uncharacterized protein YciI